ncbi:MAG: LytR C-terminal domain-containing protein [Acidimicrobiia bacterium]
MIAGIVGLQILDDTGTSNAKLGGTGATTATTAAATATSGAARPNNEVRVKVYNASGVDKQAQVMSDKLKTQNWAVQEPATLTPTRPGTAVQCVAAFENEATVLATSVGQGAVVEPYPANPPSGASDADCLVILGKT